MYLAFKITFLFPSAVEPSFQTLSLSLGEMLPVGHFDLPRVWPPGQAWVPWKFPTSENGVAGQIPLWFMGGLETEGLWESLCLRCPPESAAQAGPPGISPGCFLGDIS